MRTQGEGTVYRPGGGSSLDTKPASTLVWDFPVASRTEKQMSVVYAVCVILGQQPEQTRAVLVQDSSVSETFQHCR